MLIAANYCQTLHRFRPLNLGLDGLCRMPTITNMKALPWIAVIVLAVIAAVMFRFQVVNVNTLDDERAKLDRCTKRVRPPPVAMPTPTRRVPSPGPD